jgi:hypothetical protein
MRWTKEMNSNIMRAYFRATKCESQTTGYRTLFYNEWKKIYPTTSVTEQRICDQRRVIIRNVLLTTTEIEKIKNDISMELNATLNEASITSIESSDETIIYTVDPSLEEVESFTPILREIPYEINTEFNKALIEFQGSDPNIRPTIPKIPYNRKAKSTVEAMNTLLESKHISFESIEQIHLTVYAAATAVCRILKLKFPSNQVKHRTDIQTHKPEWKTRLESKIATLRSDLTKLLNWYTNRNKKYSNIILKHKINPKSNNFETEFLIVTDTIKQKITAMGKRLKRYNKSLKRKDDNRKFNSNQKLFYQSLTKQESINISQPPQKQEVINFWENLWSNPVLHNNQCSWIKDEKINNSTIPKMTNDSITSEDIERIIKKLHNWKAPGLDKIQNYWWKNFPSLHKPLTIHINRIIQTPELMPDYLNEGITYLKCKSDNTADPKNYRPITCLNTLFKIITSCISYRVEKFLTANQILTEQQKGCKKFSQGCKEQLIIDTITCKQVQKKNRNLSTAWIDYKKAYDSVPHSWLIEVLYLYKIDTNIINFLKHSMKKWSTKLHLSLPKSTFESHPIKIKRGIFQGDSWSPLWFCLALNPLSNLLNRTKLGYKIDKNQTLSNLLYMDDLKLYAADQIQLHSLLETTAIFSTDIKMDFGIDKCAVLHVKKGKITSTENMELDLSNITIPTLNIEQSYKYLGIQQTLLQSKPIVKENLIKSYLYRLKLVLKSSLNAVNKIKSINSWCTPVLMYSFGTVAWSKTELEALDRKTRVMMTEYRVHHPKSAVERLYLPRKKGGRGLLNLEMSAIKQINNLKIYFISKTSTSSLHKAIVSADKNLSALNLSSNNFTDLQTQTETIAKWKQKPLHGRFAHSLDNAHKTSTHWLEEGSLYGETEGFMIAIQDQVIATRNYQKFIEKIESDTDICRVCNRESETIQHISSGCSLLSNTEYLHRHNLSAKIVHQFLAHKYNLITITEPYYKYQPQPVLENNNFKIYWDRPVITDKTILANRPDLIIINKENKTAKLIDIAHPNDHNLNISFTNKISKYKDLAEEIKHMWHLNSIEIIPIVISVNGLIHQNQYKFTEKIEVPKFIIYKIQKSVILETCRIVRKVLNIND